jgi:hypothetical protein
MFLKHVYVALYFEKQTEEASQKESKKKKGKKEIQQPVYNGEILICFSTAERQGDGKL